MKMPFGKHKGTKVASLEYNDPSYIIWLHDNCDLHGELETIVKEMYPRCRREVKKMNKKKSKKKRSTFLWTDEDIANMEADMDEDDYNFYSEIPYPIPNFDY